jgi:membrane protein
VTQRLQVVIDRAPADKAPRRLLYPLYAGRVLLQVIRNWAHDRCPQQAASLSFQTALSLVPMVAICLALLRATGAFAAESALVDFLARQVIPVSRDDIASYLLRWAGNLSFQTAGVAGIVTTLVLSFFLYSSLEKIYNDIWHVERRRSLGSRFVVFYAVATIVPLFLGISIYQAARYGLTEGSVGWLAALGSTWAALFCANKLLPATEVRWGPAAIGALVTALAFEISKHLFRLYVLRVAFKSYSGIYGTIGLVVITLMWMYYSWLMVLFGAEVAHTVQNLHHLERRSRQTGDPLVQVNGVVAARVLVAITAAWTRGERLRREDVGDRFDLDEEVVVRITHRLAEARLLTVDSEDGYVPARPPATITLADVFALFRASDAGGDRGRQSSGRLDVVLTELDAAARERARTATIEDLARA